MKTAIVLSLLLALNIAHAAAETLTSVQPGFWHEPATWGPEGSFPGSGTDVIVRHSVVVEGAESCRDLLVEATGILSTDYGYRTLQIYGDAVIDGAVFSAVGGWPLDVTCYGDLELNGEFTPQSLTFGGPGDHRIVLDADAVVHPRQLSAFAGGLITAATTLRLQADTDLGGARLVLEPGTGLELRGGFLSGAMVSAAGNPITSSNGASLGNSTVDQAVLHGLTRAYGGLVFTGVTQVVDTLQTHYGNVQVTFDDLVNDGVIQNGDWSLECHVLGNVTHAGEWTGAGLVFDGAGQTHAWEQAPFSILEVESLDLAAGSGPLTLTSDVAVDSQIDLHQGELYLTPDVVLKHAGGILRNGTLFGEGGRYEGMFGSELTAVTLEDSHFMGETTLGNQVVLRGTTINEGTLTSPYLSAVTATVHGSFVNLVDVTGSLTLDVTGDLENLGNWSNVLTRLVGTEDQHVACDDEFFLGETLRLVSGLGGTGHQWSLDGDAWPGGAHPDCDLSPAGTAHHGSWRCTSSEGTSRRIVIGAAATAAGDPTPNSLSLAGAYPNPFNPSCEIRWELGARARVRLEIYDLQGRRLALLTDGELPAGPHARQWDAAGRPSGPYLYRLRAGAEERSGRLLLLK